MLKVYLIISILFLFLFLAATASSLCLFWLYSMKFNRLVFFFYYLIIINVDRLSFQINDPISYKCHVQKSIEAYIYMYLHRNLVKDIIS